ncbi:uncharacterized protein LOC119325336 [Triticum dicoccoides]|uniref:uncharacterized protein LOC119325336 n=1 Tax=Triticum dicoccoides TaxID=85692 RepID=UPI001890E66E|nr:uncharacterized protein LOC119325336 [Triticum dicoccoides]XP_037454979.1 uncharacterized protein LOC119325336 [Triticum dicoccoides]XP_037454980.1 uncharacterized protein LOC119325336 [Triticum dicoccoides]XP_037454981.1 uncharacterized protein LOC119325336 [Triticum dicoccoides]
MVAPRRRRRSPSGPDGRPHAGGGERSARGAMASEQKAAARVSVNRPAPSPKLNAGADRINALPDHLLLEILERLDLREAVRAGALSRRWRRLPKHLSRVDLDVAHFQGATPLEAMDAFTGAAWSLLAGVPLAESSALKSLILGFYMPSPSHLSTIGRLVQDVVSLGQTECLEFCISVPSRSNTVPQLAEIGRQFMSFCRTYPVAFSWLTSLALERLAFGTSDITELIRACGRLRCLILGLCRMVDLHSTLKIDTPHSGIQELKFTFVGCMQINLISVPKLRQVVCHYCFSSYVPLHFGYVPELRNVILNSRARAWQRPFALSECLSRSASNLSSLHLGFKQQMIRILPEHPKKLTAMFRNLTSVFLWGIFNECDLNWTLFILEAAPCLTCIDLSRHSCIETPDNSAEKTNVVWEPSKDLKHLNLKLLVIHGCEDEDKVTDYVRLVMERAVWPLIIQLQDEFPCSDCNATNLDRSKADKASRRRIKERLAHGSSSFVEIII